MKRLMDLFQKRERLLDITGFLMGLALFGSIAAVLKAPENRVVLLLLFFSGAGVNINNGIRLCQNPRQRNMGYSMLLLGAVILVLGFYVLGK